MKILFLTYHFAPHNHIGAVRCSKIAKYLTKMGDEVRVLTATPKPFNSSLPIEIEEACVRWVRCPHVGRSRLPLSEPGSYVSSLSRTSLGKRMIASAIRAAKTIAWYPDNVALWRRGLIEAGREEIRAFKPDVILASGPPFTALMAASELSRESGVPWVAELRDLWTDNHNYSYPDWRRRLERRLEHKTLSSASFIVTVSDPLAAILKDQHSSPVAVVLNGFEPEDYQVTDTPLGDADALHVAYTGNLYVEKQNIDIFFRGLSKVDGVVLHVFGRSADLITNRAKEYGMVHAVRNHGSVAYKRSLSAQKEADALLLLMWDDPAQKGVFTGKLFEYLGARRPIICVGSFEDTAGALVRELKSGYIALKEAAVEAILIELREAKRAGTGLELPVSAGLLEFTRREQVGKLRAVLATVHNQVGNFPQCES